MTDEEFNAALKLEDPTARYVMWNIDGLYYAKVMTQADRPEHNGSVWITRMTTTGYKHSGFAVRALKKAFIERGLPPL